MEFYALLVVEQKTDTASRKKELELVNKEPIIQKNEKQSKKKGMYLLSPFLSPFVTNSTGSGSTSSQSGWFVQLVGQ